jgi:hypothetical protein
MERRLNKDFIEVEIIAEKESQKGVLIGKEGHALKLLSTAARLDIEDFVGKEVYLEVSHPLQSCFFPASFLSLQPTPQEGYIYGIMSDLSFDIW